MLCALLALQALLSCVFRQCFSQSPYLLQHVNVRASSMLAVLITALMLAYSLRAFGEVVSDTSCIIYDAKIRRFF